MTRSEHMQWCKNRALAYCNSANPDDNKQAFASMASDLQKHPETEGHIGIQLGMMHLMSGLLKSNQDMRKFIEGFN